MQWCTWWQFTGTADHTVETWRMWWPHCCWLGVCWCLSLVLWRFSKELSPTCNASCCPSMLCMHATLAIMREKIFDIVWLDYYLQWRACMSQLQVVVQSVHITSRENCKYLSLQWVLQVSRTLYRCFRKTNPRADVRISINVALCVTLPCFHIVLMNVLLFEFMWCTFSDWLTLLLIVHYMAVAVQLHAYFIYDVQIKQVHSTFSIWWAVDGHFSFFHLLLCTCSQMFG